MKRLLVLAAVLTLLCSINLSIAHSQEAFSMVMVVGPDATISLRSVIDSELFLTSYYIIAPTGLADVPGWHSLAEQFQDDPEGIRSIFGQHVGMTPLLSGASSLGDGQWLYLEEIGFRWPDNLTWQLGKPLGDDVTAIRQAVDNGSLTWVGDYCDLCAPDFPIVFEIPEPSTLVLVLVGAAAVLLRGWAWSSRSVELR